MKNLINIGIPSKGRLRKDVLKIFTKKRLKLISERGERDLIGSIKNKSIIKILYLHAREIIERLGDGSLDIGFSGFDLLKESGINTQNKISKLNVVFSTAFGRQLEYYTGIVFKIDIKLKSKIINCCNGGRYDKLISDLGSKKQVPAVGAALNLNYQL